ncbi:MAG: hypothetical protein FWD17_05560 [Polyangiaceae bacterium]|nr:hypothetical protein [Polyangiaceae bacterium]
MTTAERHAVELEALVDAASKDLAQDGVARAGDDLVVARSIERALSLAGPLAGRPAKSAHGFWARRGIVFAGAAAIASIGALALLGLARHAVAPRHAGYVVPVPPPSPLPVDVPSESPSEPPVREGLGGTPAASPPAPRSLPAAASPDPATLFSQANESRRKGDAAGAAARYGLLQRLFPASPEAALSHVALGRLYLDRMHDAVRALSQFDAYLRATGHDGLREEALVGRALALQELGRADEERAAWHALLAAFPGTLSSDRAKERLRDLR